MDRHPERSRVQGGAVSPYPDTIGSGGGRLFEAARQTSAMRTIAALLVAVVMALACLAFAPSKQAFAAEPDDIITGVTFTMSRTEPISYDSATREYTFAYTEGASGTGIAYVTFKDGATVTMTYKSSTGVDSERTCTSGAMVNMGPFLVSGNVTLNFTLTATLGDETQVYKCTVKRIPRAPAVTIARPDGTALSFSNSQAYVPAGVDAVDVSARPYSDGCTVTINGEPVEANAVKTLACDYDDDGRFVITVVTERDGLSAQSTYTVIKDEDLPADALAGGVCGDNLKWYVTPKGVLRIYGTGAMTNFTNMGAPWMSLRDQITSIQMDEGITSIGNYAFSTGQYGVYLMNNVKRVVIPNSVTSIGSNAFCRMGSLASVSLGSGVKTIGSYAFAQTPIKTVVIPESVTNVQMYAFRQCPNLKSVEVYAQEATLGNYVFQNCTEFTDVYLGNGITSLGTYAFAGCAKLSSVTYDAQVAVPNNAFQNCTSLTSISLPNGIASIGNNAFAGCTALKSVSMGDDVTSIGNYAFSGCSALSSIVIPDSVTSLGTGAFQSCSGATSLSIGAGVKQIPNYAFDGCSSLAAVEIPAQVTSIGQYAFRNADAITSVVIPAGVETLDNYAFRNCDNLESVKIESAAVEFNAYQFMECPKLANIESAGGLKTDDNGIVYSSDGKTLIMCPGTLTGKVVVPEGVESIGENAFAGCTQITEVELPTTAREVGASAFDGCTALAKADLPASVTEVKAGTFQNTALAVLPAMPGVTTIGDDAFNECSQLTSAIIPESVTTIGKRAFSGCASLAELELPSKLSSFGESAFRGCTSLTSVEVPGSIGTLPTSAFQNCSALKDVTLNEGIASIGTWALAGTSIEFIEIPEGVTTLGDYAFAQRRADCPKEVVLPTTLQSISQNYTFGPNNDLRLISAYVEHFYYRGTDDQFQDLLAASGNYNAARRLVNCPVTYLYGSEGEKPVVTEVSDTLTFAQNASAADALKLSVAPIPDSASVAINWYKRNADNTFARMDTAVDGVTATCTPDTAEVGAYSYFAVATLTQADGSKGCIVTDDVRVLVGVEFTSGDGSAENPFEIANLTDLMSFKLLADEGVTTGLNFRLGADITLPSLWQGVGTFYGTFDGDGHTVTVPRGGQPLFTSLSRATVENLGIAGEYIASNGLASGELMGFSKLDNITVKEDAVIKGSGLVNSVAGSGNGVDILNCTVERGVKIGWDADANAPAEQGGLSGYYTGVSGVGSFAGSMNGTIVNCVSYADVYGDKVVGGILGRQAQSMSKNVVKNCEFHGNVHATGNSVGGIVGAGYIAISAPNGTCVSIQNCLVTGTVEGADYVGGIFGGEGNATAGVEEAWDNGIGYVTDNLFTGTVKASDDAVAVGAIIGYMRGINAFNVIENNYYVEGCGARAGIGKAFHVDTSAEPYGIADDGTFFFNTAVDDLYQIYLIVDGADDAYRSVTGRTGAVRSDNPLTNTAVTAPVAAASLVDGTTADALNAGAYTLGNWTYDDEGTKHIAGAFIVSLELSGDYKTEYAVGDEFDSTGMVVTAAMSDGTAEEVDLADCTFELDTATPGTKTATVTYGKARATFTALVAQGTTDYDPEVAGTVYISVSKDQKFMKSDGAVSGIALAYLPVDLAEVAAIDLADYGFADYKLVASDASADYRYDVNVLQLFAYVQSVYGADGDTGLTATGGPGSLYIQSFMGHSDNFNYYVNGAYPESAPGWGATCDEIALADGDYVDVVMFTSRNFNDDPAAGLHFFTDKAGEVTHEYAAYAGVPTTVTLSRIYESTDGLVPEGGWTLYAGTQEQWDRYVEGRGTTGVITATTGDDGSAQVTLEAEGTYVLWAEGGTGTGVCAGMAVNGPAYATISVKEGLAIDAAELPEAAALSEYRAELSLAGGAAEGVTWFAEDPAALPEGITLSADGVLSGTPAAPGEYTFTVIAATETETSEPATFTLTVAGETPSLTTTELPAAAAGEEYSATIAAAGTPAPEVTVSGLPEGLSFDAATGAISGTPVVGGAYEVTIAAASGLGEDSATITLEVVEAAVLATTELPAATEGEPYEATLEVAGYPEPTVMVTGLPEGLSYDAATGTISGTPTSTGDFSVRVIARNSQGATGMQSIPMHVTSLDEIAGAEVAAMIEALPESDDVTVDDAEAIAAATEAYMALSDAGRAAVGEELTLKLADDSAALVIAQREKAEADAAAAKAVEDSIAALPAADEVTADDAEAIEAAQAALDALTDDQAALVSDEAKAKLAAAREALDALGPANATIKRIAGEYTAADTAAAISAEAFEASEWVVVAREDDFADALGATGLAGVLDAPIVLTDRFGLSESAAAEVARLGAKRAYVIGGTGAIKEQVDSDLAALGVEVEPRLWGDNSYDTSLACAKEIVRLGGRPDEAIISMSTNFADALSMSPYAYKFGVPVVLQTWGATSADRGFTGEAAEFLAGKSVLVAGGPGAISDASLVGLQVTERIYGDSGYDTSQAVADWMVGEGHLSADAVVIACGAQAPKGVDALAGAALAGRLSAPMLLVNGNVAMEGVDTATIDGFVTEHASEIKAAYVLGGAYVAPQDLYERIRDLIGAEDLSA